MTSRFIRLAAASGFVLAIAGCATAPSDSPESGASSASTGSSERSETAGSRESAREPVTATEAAVAERRAAGPAGTGSSSSDMAKLVEQLNEAARELATLRTANAKLRAERERAPRPAPAAEPAAASRPDPADERLAASLKSYAAFKQEMTSLLAEVERARKGNAELGADLKAATEQMKQARAALARAEEDLKVEKRLRIEAETNAGQLRDQLRTIARAMADAGLSADKLSSTAEGGGSRARGAATPPSRYVARDGDTLMKIADRVYGDSGKWRLLLEANRSRVDSDGSVKAGTELQIPRP